jgi:D-glycero-D-manno-heptose 1,7-bisphosphate phosphatase
MSPQQKVLTHEEIDAWIAAERAAGRKVGFTCGAFDVMHAGHAHYLARARELCDRLLVAVNSDESIRRYKSPLRPVNPHDQRMFMVAALASVDAVTVLEENRPLDLLLRWKPDFYIKGGDYEASALRSGDAVRAYGGEVEVIRPEWGTSTSAMIERIVALSAHAEPERPAGTPAAGLALIDRDGTLIRNVPFLSDPDRVELMPGAGEGLAAMQAAGFRLAIVTNQQGIGLGYCATDSMIAVNQRLFRLLGPHGVRISRVYFCPHSAADCCDCRKPAPGMLRRAMREFGIAPDSTYMIGDTAADMEAGAAAGCSTVYVGGSADVRCTFRAAGFFEAAQWVAGRTAVEERL